MTFDQKTSRLYSSLKHRELELVRKACGNPKLPTSKVNLSFTKDEFRDWLNSDDLGGRTNRVLSAKGERIWHCEFCSLPLDVEAVSIDHDKPLSLGGRTALDNFIVCCKACNTSKWKLGAAQYRSLRACVNGAQEEKYGFGIGLVKDMLLYPGGFDNDAKVHAIKFLDRLMVPWPPAMQQDFWRRWNSMPVFMRRKG